MRRVSQSCWACVVHCGLGICMKLELLVEMYLKNMQVEFESSYLLIVYECQTIHHSLFW